jgi:hypothetical protein
VTPADVGVVLDELDRSQPLDDLETELHVQAGPQRCVVRDRERDLDRAAASSA